MSFSLYENSNITCHPDIYYKLEHFILKIDKNILNLNQCLWKSIKKLANQGLTHSRGQNDFGNYQKISEHALQFPQRRLVFAGARVHLRAKYLGTRLRHHVQMLHAGSHVAGGA